MIFFDEIDALMMSRGGANESEATRRLKVIHHLRISDLQSVIASLNFRLSRGIDAGDRQYETDIRYASVSLCFNYAS